MSFISKPAFDPNLIDRIVTFGWKTTGRGRAVAYQQQRFTTKVRSAGAWVTYVGAIYIQAVVHKDAYTHQKEVAHCIEFQLGRKSAFAGGNLRFLITTDATGSRSGDCVHKSCDRDCLALRILCLDFRYSLRQFTLAEIP